MSLISWLAAFATIVGASLTAANLRARITGYGFVAFTASSILWVAHASKEGQTSLLWTNAFLLVINAVGVRRWLFRRAKFEHGAEAASEESAASRSTPTLRAASTLIGSEVVDADGGSVGRIVDYLVRCQDGAPAYYVISTKENLFGVAPSELRLTKAAIALFGPSQRIFARAPLVADEWPSELRSA